VLFCGLFEYRVLFLCAVELDLREVQSLGELVLDELQLVDSQHLALVVFGQLSETELQIVLLLDHSPELFIESPYLLLLPIHSLLDHHLLVLHRSQLGAYLHLLLLVVRFHALHLDSHPLQSFRKLLDFGGCDVTFLLVFLQEEVLLVLEFVGELGELFYVVLLEAGLFCLEGLNGFLLLG